MRTQPDLSIVVPVFNENAALDPFLERLLPVVAGLALSCEIVFVNDGSSDATLEHLERIMVRDPRIKAVNLSRNFGKDAALTAGLDHAAGRAVICMDADLQDPPELITEFVKKWREGYSMVYGYRTDRQSDTFAKRVTAHLFYSLFNRIADAGIPANAGDFRLLDRKAVDALRRLPERSRFMKGLFAWVGFRQASVPYVREARTAGGSKWNYWRLWNFALDGLLSFSSLPLRVWSYIGILLSVIAFLYAGFLIVRTLFLGIDVPGYASLMVAVLFLGGINLISLGIVGEYVNRVFLEVKQRPVYIIDKTYGIHAAKSEGR